MKKITDMFGFRVCQILLLISGAVPAALSGPSLDCTNDFDKLMSCNFQAQNCFEYNLTLWNTDVNIDEEKWCVFQECDTDPEQQLNCCCCITITPIYGESHKATVWKGNTRVVFKHINIMTSIKPKTPTLLSVNESNGNFQLNWKTNMDDYISTHLTAMVTYYKKGDTEKVYKNITPTSVDGLKYYEIIGRHLEPSTTYVVSVRSYTNWSDKYSDSSEEREFTTPASFHTVTLGIIIGVSAAAIILTCVVFGCCDKVKAKWVDAVAKCPAPKLLDVHPAAQKGQPQCDILKPLATDISRVSVDSAIPNTNKQRSEGFWTDSGSHEQSSEITAGSLSLSCVEIKPVDIKARVQDAVSKAFAQVMPLTSVTISQLSEDAGSFSTPYNPCGVKANESNSHECTDFDNMSYFGTSIMTESSEVHTQAESICDPAYHPSEGDPVTCAEQQVQVSSLMPVDMSYH